MLKHTFQEKGGLTNDPSRSCNYKKIAAVHVHVERKMHHIKSYKILVGEFDSTLFDCIEQLVHVCAHLTNFQSFDCIMKM